MHDNPFSAQEVESRIARVRAAISKRKLDAAIFASPENVFWLTGLDHWGYFAPHLLVVPVEGRPVLVTRVMERVSVEKQVKSADFRGHPDSETAADMMARVLKDIKLQGRHLGIESWTSGMSLGLGTSLQQQVPATWSDVTNLVDTMRLVKSAEEQALMRKAAAVTDAAAAAAFEVIHDGAREADVVAACLSAMAKAGGDMPGFGPFIRPGSRLGEEHGTWGRGAYHKGEPIFFELSGCVSRYHAPLGRLVRVGSISDPDARMAEVTKRAFDAVVKTLKPGLKARDIYAAWQAVVDDAGLPHYRRHHCGYCVGVGLPPSWTGGNTVVGLRGDSDMDIRSGMSFHVLSWLMGTGKGDDFISNTVLLTDAGAEVLTRTPSGPIIR